MPRRKQQHAEQQQQQQVRIAKEAAKISKNSISKPRMEALQYALNGGASPIIHADAAESEASSSSANPDENFEPRMLSSEERRISSLTFLSLRAPRAPGEPAPEESTTTAMNQDKTERTRHSVSFPKEDSKEERRTIVPYSREYDGYRGTNCGTTIPQYVEGVMVLNNVAVADSAKRKVIISSNVSYDGSYSTRGETIQVSLPSMVTIPELEVSSVPAPPANLQRQPNVAVPGAWTMPHVFRSFTSAGRQQEQPRDEEYGNDGDDNASYASRTTVRSLLTATWSLIHPTRRLESVQPIVAVKPAKDEATMQRKYFLCCVGVCVLVLICLTGVLVFVMLQNAPSNESGAPSPAPFPEEFAPTPEPFLPDKPEDGGTIAKPRRVGTPEPSTRRRQDDYFTNQESSENGEGFWSR
jgi:hypothetical protein